MGVQGILVFPQCSKWKYDSVNFDLRILAYFLQFCTFLFYFFTRKNVCAKQNVRVVICVGIKVAKRTSPSFGVVVGELVSRILRSSNSRFV